MSDDIPQAGAPDDDRDHRPLPKVDLPSINREPVSDRSNAGYLAHTPGLGPEAPQADGAPERDAGAPAESVEAGAAEAGPAEPGAADPGHADRAPVERGAVEPEPAPEPAEPAPAAPESAPAAVTPEEPAPSDRPAPPRRRGAVIGTVAVVVAAIAGTVVYWAMQSGLIG